jgi:hypothetical protein
LHVGRVAGSLDALTVNRAWERLRIGRDAHVSNQLPFGSAMNRHHDVQRETRAHDLVKPLVRLALKSPEHAATLRHAPHAVRPQTEHPVTTDLLLLRPTDQALIQSPLEARNVRRDFRKVVDAAGLVGKEWAPRELRHSFVSRFRCESADRKHLLAGWSSLDHGLRCVLESVVVGSWFGSWNPAPETALLILINHRSAQVAMRRGWFC